MPPARTPPHVSRHFSAATTRMAEASRAESLSVPPLLAERQVIVSSETRIAYRVERLIGKGGFGQVYLARRLGTPAAVPDVVCIKASSHIGAWLREAYFGQLLDGHPRAIRVFDRFPLWQGGQVVYCLTLEYAPHGDLAAFLGRDGRRWTETAVRREMAGILDVLRTLHRGQSLHRDLTPLNLFVCDGRRLKLGDFGIVRQQNDRRGVTARTMNTLTAPSELVAREVPKWQARDDVYQIGQLLGMLLRGDARARVRTSDIRGLACSDHLKEIVYRCLGERRKRYEAADELIAALQTPPPALRPGVLRSLKGVHLAFTGILSRRRDEAVRAAKRAGAIVHGSPTAATTVLVRGRPNPLQAAGRDAGLKLMELKRLRAKGHRITVLTDAQFWRLAGRT